VFRTETDYVAPHSLGEALQILRERAVDSTILAGGTDLVPRFNAGLSYPRLLVDLRNLPLDQLRHGSEGLALGSRVTHGQVVASRDLSECLPALVQACREVAGPSVRSRATLGGNLANASPAADSAPPLLAYDADLVLARMGAERIMPLADFFCGPGKTALQPNEILTEIHIPLPPPATAAAFIKLGKRHALAISVASVAVRITLDGGGAILAARIALGAVAPTPVRALSAEALLCGEKLSESLISAAACEAQRAASPIDDVRASGSYRRAMVSVLVARALRAVWQELSGEIAHA
jgi:CO/xanthine dehydrogenase FAD-binding subunit